MLTGKGTGLRYQMPPGAKVGRPSQAVEEKTENKEEGQETPVEEVQVNMIRTNSELPAGPLALLSRSQLEVPKYSGRQEDWPSFEKDWEEYYNVWRMDQYEGLALSLLKKAVDETTGLKLETRRRDNLQEGYHEVWNHLKVEQGRYLNQAFRRAWVHLGLPKKE